MAQVWIEEIISHSPHELRLLSTDPTFWPYIEGAVYKESWISVKPGAKLKASRFIIPWWNSKGRLLIEYRGRSCYCWVGPNSATSNDFLRVFDDKDTVIAEAEMGPRGDNIICSVSLRLITRGDDKPVEFQLLDSSGIGKIDTQAVINTLVQIAALVAEFFKK
jgi:hypothetical protein